MLFCQCFQGREVPLPSGVNLKGSADASVVDGGDGPRDADAEEDVDGVGTGDVADGGVGGIVLDGSDLGGEGVCEREPQSENYPRHIDKGLVQACKLFADTVKEEVCYKLRLFTDHMAVPTHLRHEICFA